MFLTSLYTFRLVFLVFFGEAQRPAPSFRPAGLQRCRSSSSAALSVVGGFIDVPAWLGGLTLLARSSPALPAAP